MAAAERHRAGQAEAAEPPARDAAAHDEEEMPRVRLTRRRAIALRPVRPHGDRASCTSSCRSSPGVGETVHRIEHGDNWWIAIGVVLELLSFGGYMVLFRAVFVRGIRGH